jgi:membrane protease YdiL (CAAX protease family)
MQSTEESQVVIDVSDISDDARIVPVAAPDPTYPSIWQSFGILLIFLLCMIAATPIMLVVGPLDADIAMLLCYSVAGGLTFAIVHAIRSRKTGHSTYCFRIESGKLIIPLILTSMALLLGVILPLISLIPMPREVSESFAKSLGRPSLVIFVTLVIAAPILEELLFRGIMLDGLLNRYRPLTAILVSSIIFGIAHLNPWQFVTAFVIGCFAGWVYLRTKSVGPCILIHATVNCCAYLLQVLASGVNISSQTQESQISWPEFLVFPAMCLLVIFASVHYLQQEFNRTELAQADEKDTLIS